MSNRSIVYIDGFNFYYGAVRGTPYKWLNLELLFRRLRQDDDLQAIYYFTALLDGPKGGRQKVYLRALATLPKVHVVLGKFKTKQIKCRVSACAFPGSRVFDAPEEKRTDVNIALQMLNDMHHNRADRMVLVSGDSDLVPAVDLVKTESPRTQVIVYVPSRHVIRGAAVELRAAANKHRTFPQQLLKVCQFPAELSDGRAGIIRKPPEW
ncbi:MAG: NYN domain-containing protein [Phycisphaerae bacterium]